MNSKFFLLALLILVAFISVIALYLIEGPGWDLIAHYENGKSLLNPAFYACLSSPPCGMNNGVLTFWYGTYFEPYRAPASMLIFALLYIIFGSNSITVYVILLLAVYLLVIWFISKHFNIDTLILYALLLNPAIIFTSIIIGSEEMMSLIFLLIGLQYLAKRSPLFGLFLGLATLGKYPTLALIPMLLLLIKPKKILFASILFAVALAPWLLFNQIFFHNPLASYNMSLAIAADNKQAFWISPSAYVAIFQYAIIFLLLVFFAIYNERKTIIKLVNKTLSNKNLIKSMYTNDRFYLYTTFFIFFFLSLGATLYFSPYYDTTTQVRYGYLLSTSSVLIVALVMDDLKKFSRMNLPMATATVSIFLIVISLITTYILSINGTFQWYSSNSVYRSAATTLRNLGYANCRIVTNDWVYLLYYNIKAFSQFYINSSTEQYPILIFYNQTSVTNSSFIQGLANATPAYVSKNFTILLPENYRCFN